MAQRDVRDTGTDYPIYRMTLVVDDGESDVPVPTRRGLMGWFQQASPLRVFLTILGWLLLLSFMIAAVALVAFGIFVFQHPA